MLSDVESIHVCYSQLQIPSPNKHRACFEPWIYVLPYRLRTSEQDVAAVVIILSVIMHD